MIGEVAVGRCVKFRGMEGVKVVDRGCSLVGSVEIVYLGIDQRCN